eukprot:CAMPEP_0185770024 /NCGR_PEP_ID=MMETSP1174-20130828/57134_1 /TAXON_ID=35687 /ORGANISM="Dictyocha speculum, Strain CCMP1381" /LENGTH=931 /DNA_ID=CAMNT_0028455309 /DNA_START=42 /DNA_END=2837 /DNA_ORIENTATION=+
MRIFVLAFLLSFSSSVFSVDQSKFRTCKETGFCRRNRNRPGPPPQFSVLPSSVATHGKDGLTALLQSNQLEAPPLKMGISVYDSGVVRMQIREANPEKPRWEAADILLDDALTSIEPSMQAQESSMRLEFGEGRALVLEYEPFSVTLLIDGEASAVVNGRGLFHFEYHRSREGEPSLAAPTDDEDRHKGKKIVGYWEDGLAIYEDGSREVKVKDETSEEPAKGDGEEDGFWEESFGGHTDSKPLGPASVGIDVDFPGSKHLYGIPEHASSMALKATTGPGADYSDPYRLYTLDVFEYDLDVPMALYGGIPLVWSHTTRGTVGAFWFNPTETFIDIEKDDKSARSRWISESGIVDLMLIPGPTPADAISQFTQLVGTTDLPPMFSLGYHQCRWNYKDEADVAQVHAKFEELNFPYDVLWLDIEHTDGKRYFTWDDNVFPNPIAMQENISKYGRKMVTIVDPHLKRDNNYYIHTEATDKGLYIKNKDGSDYDGWCWPGSSSYLDFTQPHVREWWAEQFKLENYKGSTMDLFTWNDMNEPSVFNGPEVTMQKDVVNLDGIEHREWHNLYGMYQQRATAEGHILRSGGVDRPFVLSRSFFAGSQRWGAIWTGDNKADWEHLAIASPMLLSIGLGGLTFSGADVGGFFGNTDSELMVRWMQAGSFTPFFRGHAHHDSKRREPWMFGEPTTSQLRSVVMARYSLLPYWYTLFYAAYTSGLPTMRPLWINYPKDEATFEMDDQWMVGADIVVKPVTAPGVTKTEIYLPGDGPWYDVESLEAYSAGKVTLATPLAKIAALQRGGSIIPRKLRLRRSTKFMINDPYTLYIALDKQGKASGDLYIDDETTFNHKSGNFALRHFNFDSLVLESTSGVPTTFTANNRVERLVFIGLERAPKTVSVSSKSKTGSLTFDYDSRKKILTVRKPDVFATEDFKITVS